MSTPISSRLYTEASEKLAEQIEKEKKVEDPDLDEALAAIEEADENTEGV